MVLPRYAKAVLSAYGTKEAERIMLELSQNIGAGRITAPLLSQISAAAVEIAKSRTPVDTGRLLSRNRYRQLTPHSTVIYNDAPYAGYVEDGTSKMAARPFLRPAVMLAKAEFPSIFVKDYRQFYEELLRKHKPT